MQGTDVPQMTIYPYLKQKTEWVMGFWLRKERSCTGTVSQFKREKQPTQSGTWAGWKGKLPIVIRLDDYSHPIGRLKADDHLPLAVYPRIFLWGLLIVSVNLVQRYKIILCFPNFLKRNAKKIKSKRLDLAKGVRPESVLETIELSNSFIYVMIFCNLLI